MVPTVTCTCHPVAWTRCWGLPTDEQVEVGPSGTITTFCVVHIGFGENAPPTPFVSALILPDGAAASMYGTVLGIGHEEVRIGMRVQPVWADETRCRHREHPALGADRRARRSRRAAEGTHVMRDVAIVSVAQSDHRRAVPEIGEVEMVQPVIAAALDGCRGEDLRHRVHLLGELRLPGRPGVQLRDDSGCGRRLAADRGVPRRDGRRLGAVRGLAEDPGRSRRHGARLRLLQGLAG